MSQGLMKREKIEEMPNFVDFRGKYRQDSLNNSRRTSLNQLSPLVIEVSADGRVRNAIGEWEKYKTIPEISLDDIDIKKTSDVAIERGSGTYLNETSDVFYNDTDDSTDEQKVNDLSAESSFTESDTTDAVETIISPCLEESFKEGENKHLSVNLSFDIFDNNDIVFELSPLIKPNRHSSLALANNPAESIVSASARSPKVLVEIPSASFTKS
eukprot:CAMPEP_0119042624 /NCGR_PEP_ID=MMETSP1177-20130426/16029_1 /TAXON_ID=2985 /ORGANISM="Ochromonas sp, Strain CCMP1899" /LENGTH=212 /DNA_ID=CAMNT_0007009547 /DNA_START=114 /DNA_END=751 /DNA_ORIENTATION=+